MIECHTVLGNVRDDPRLRERLARMTEGGHAERLALSRFEAARTRLRKTGERGSDIVLDLPAGTQLHDGDVVWLTDERMVVVAQQPERVAIVHLSEDESPEDQVETALRVGHALGNLHRPIQAHHRECTLPIQAESELDVVRKLIHRVAPGARIESAMAVFDPEMAGEEHSHDH